MTPGGRGPRHENRSSVALLKSKTGSCTIDSPHCFSNFDSYVSKDSIETYGVSPPIFQFDRSLPLNILLYFISLASAGQPFLLTLLLHNSLHPFYHQPPFSQHLIADLSPLFSYYPSAAVTEASSACCWLAYPASHTVVSLNPQRIRLLYLLCRSVRATVLAASELDFATTVYKSRDSELSTDGEASPSSLARMAPAAALVITIRCDRDCLLPADIYKQGKSAAAGGLPVCWRQCWVSGVTLAQRLLQLATTACQSPFPVVASQHMD